MVSACSRKLAHGREYLAELRSCRECRSSAADRNIAGSFAVVVAVAELEYGTVVLEDFLHHPAKADFAAVFGLHTEALVTAVAAAGWVELVGPSADSSGSGALDSVDWKVIERSTVMTVDSEQRLAVRLVFDKSFDSVDELAHIRHLKLQKKSH